MKLDEMRIAGNGGLLPCPHCGEQEHLYLAYRMDAHGKLNGAPYCIDCIGCGHEFLPREGADVVAAWNRRADATGAEVLRLREALEFYADPYEAAQLKCTNGHDRCAGGSFEGCPYCVYTVDIPEYYEDLDFGARARRALDGDER